MSEAAVSVTGDLSDTERVEVRALCDLLIGALELAGQTSHPRVVEALVTLTFAYLEHAGATQEQARLALEDRIARLKHAQ